jgi:hypothetical protein
MLIQYLIHHAEISRIHSWWQCKSKPLEVLQGPFRRAQIHRESSLAQQKHVVELWNMKIEAKKT